MNELGLDVLDLFLIHWPQPMFDQYVETWRAFERLLADGRVSSIGVSNFEIAHLERLLAETDVVPAVNQVELHTRSFLNRRYGSSTARFVTPRAEAGTGPIHGSAAHHRRQLPGHVDQEYARARAHGVVIGGTQCAGPHSIPALRPRHITT